jgi:hypothetical protein
MPHTRRHLAAHAAEGMSCSTQWTQPATESMSPLQRPPPWFHEPCQGRGREHSNHHFPHPNVGEAELEKRKREGGRRAASSSGA